MVTFSLGNRSFTADLQAPIDISIPVSPQGITVWGVEQAEITPHREGSFVGSVALGASVNFNDIRFNPHAHGTHTESMGHVIASSDSVNEIPPPPWMLARLVTVQTQINMGIPPKDLAEVLEAPRVPAVIIRSFPRPASPHAHRWSGTHPAFLLPETARLLADRGVEHLLIDLPSVDPEEDGGALQAHKAFWGLPQQPRKAATITELINVPEDVPDGLYLLNLQMAAFVNDACPSRPLLFRLQPL
jgi:kynurenine formamidase